MSETNVTQALQEFVGAFEVVFRYDWNYTQVMIGEENDGLTSSNLALRTSLKIGAREGHC